MIFSAPTIPLSVSLPLGAGTVGLVGDGGKHLIRVSELSGYLQDFRVMEERAVKHSLLVDNKPIVDVKPGVQDGAIHVAEVRILAIGT